jgi:hypothetical protein
VSAAVPQSSAQDRFSPTDQAVYAGLTDGDGVIIDSQTTFYFGLNKTAALLWERLQTGHASAGELVDLLLQRYQVSQVQAAQDVHDFLAHVLEYGLVRKVV